MSCSPARLAANQANALKSTGPKTPEGKEQSRANGLKHGLTGQGIVVPDGDLADVARRTEEFKADFQPATSKGRFLLLRAAVLSVRLERSTDQEFAAVAERSRNAIRDFDESRCVEVARLMAGIADEPASTVRKLRRSPEGIDALISALLDVQASLFYPLEDRWNQAQFHKLANLIGQRPEQVSITRVLSIVHAAWGDFKLIKFDKSDGLSHDDRLFRAREQVADLIDGEVDQLRTLRQNLDFETIALDRAEAPQRALFDPSKEASLARKYEAATEREFYRALRDLREVEEAASAPVVTPCPETASPAMGSSFPAHPQPVATPPPPAPKPVFVPSTAPTTQSYPTVSGSDDGPRSIGHPQG